MLPKRRKPNHPGDVLFEEFLKPLRLSPQQFAEKLGNKWSEERVNALLEGKEDISKKTAEELGTTLNTSAEFWIDLQNNQHEWLLHHKKAS
jgi:addiction module HigA family antidote